MVTSGTDIKLVEQLIVRAVKASDSRQIWEIRNSEASRKASKNPDLIAFHDHEIWFTQRSKLSKEEPYLVAVLGSRVCGYARADRNSAGELEVSIAIAIAWHSSGFGRKLLSELEQSCSRLGVNQLCAWVAEGNLQSKNFFLSNKYAQTENKKDSFDLFTKRLN